MPDNASNNVTATSVVAATPAAAAVPVVTPTTALAAGKNVYRRIDPTAVHETILRLESRIAARFPEAGLRKVAQELVEVSRNTTVRIASLRRRSVTVRIFSWLLCTSIIGILISVPFTLRLGRVDTFADGIQVLEAALSASFFIGASILFVLSIESRLRRQRALAAIHELRALAHVVDMHQLTKDPSMLLAGAGKGATPQSPVRRYTAFELQRYLDYCSEMLALISKIAVLYVQDSADTGAIGIVDEIEDLTNGLSRKIWQKIMLIERDLPSTHAILDRSAISPQTLASAYRKETEEGE